MYRALYPFQKTHPTSLGFETGDIFIGLPGARADKNWHFVLNQKGNKGFVPRNYVNQEEKLPSKDEYEKLLEKIRNEVLSQRMGEKERAEILGKLDALKKSYNPYVNKDNKQLNINSKSSEKLTVPAQATTGGGAGEHESYANLPKAPSPRPDSLSSNEELKGMKHF